ncbi:hypothetical protein [Sphingosinicella humi]|uniref:hypothetical protein n=1 Tax=Allosphingosinicella humi TaxID=2068657 RepID=UPI0011B235D2|nr:hypothetical protein [Sphingosinicella humi]
MRQIKDRSAVYVHKSDYSFSNVRTMQEYTLAEHTVVDIEEDGLGPVYPLVRAAMPDVSLEQWLAYGSGLGGSGGVLGLSGPDGSLFGFATYEVRIALKHGRILHVDHFVIFELSGAGAARRALQNALEALARARGCGSIELRTSRRAYVDNGRAGVWTGLGYALDGAFFVKTLAAAVALDKGRPAGKRGAGTSVKARSGAVPAIAV